MVDVNDVFSSNHQVIDIYYDEYLSSRVAPDEQGIFGLEHFEADLMKILGYLQMPYPWRLLEVVERAFESAYDSRLGARLEDGWLYHVHLLI